MADQKVITDELLKLQTEKVLQVIADLTYDLVSYTDEEISDILEITDEQAMQLTKILNDQVVANNKLWSSSKTDTEIKNALIESNKYADELIGKISSISLEYVTTLPTSDIKSNVIYILQGTPNTLNVFNESTSSFVSVGDLNLDLSGYYTSTQVDNLLADKADDNTVVHADAIVSDLTTTSGTTTLSTAGLQTELDKKANDDEVLKTTDITTTINSASTDTQVASGKLLYDELLKVSNDNYIEDANNPTSFICKTDRDTLNTPYKEGLTTATISLVISVARGADSWNGQISISMGSTDFFVRDKGGIGWNPWVKLMTKTDITTTINNTSTDTQIPSAKTIYNKSLPYVYPSSINEDPNTTTSPVTHYKGNNTPNSDLWFNILTFFTDDKAEHMEKTQLAFTPNNGDIYTRTKGYNSDWKVWKKVCLTSVADVPLTNITPLHSNVTSGNVFYQVKNGICYVSLIALSINKVESSFTICEGLPRCSSKPHCVLVNGNANDILGLVYVSVSGSLGVNMRQSGTGYCEFSYPVAES